MDKNLIASIDSFIQANERNIVRDIGRLIAVNSVLDTAKEGMPFGEGPAKVLELGLEIARELGLETRNCENYIGYAALDDNDDYLATITHLDVVPAGEGWTGDPFTMRERDGYLIGRGIMDDKGPSVICLYALKFIKEAGIPLRHGLRADVYILHRIREDVLRIKNGSFYKGAGEYSMFVKEGDMIVRRTVQLGNSNYNYVEVTEGLALGDKVVVNDMDGYKGRREIKLK